MKEQLSQKEIDGYFRPGTNGDSGGDAECVPFNFRQLDPIPQSQLTAIRPLQEAFARILSESLSVYLRSEVLADLISVEQLPFSEFVSGVSSPTCIAYLEMEPYDGYSLVEVNQSLLAPVLYRVLGSNGKLSSSLDRELTDIEQDVLLGFCRIIAHDLTEAWKLTVPLQFTLDSVEKTPQRSKRIAQNETVVAIAMELHIGEEAGLLTLAIPCVTLKAMRRLFDPQFAPPKAQSRKTEQYLREKLARELIVGVECTLSGARIRLRDLMMLAPGQVLDLGIPIDTKATALFNGQPHFQGDLAVSGSNLAMIVQNRVHSSSLVRNGDERADSPSR